MPTSIGTTLSPNRCASVLVAAAGAMAVQDGVVITATLALGAMTTLSLAETALLEITIKVAPENRAAAGAFCEKHDQPFLDDVPGTTAKRLLIRDEDVQVLHGFDSVAGAQAYQTSDLFTNHVLREPGPLLQGDPEVRNYSAHEQSLASGAWHGRWRVPGSRRTRRAVPETPMQGARISPRTSEVTRSGMVGDPGIEPGMSRLGGVTVRCHTL